MARSREVIELETDLTMMRLLELDEDQRSLELKIDRWQSRYDELQDEREALPEEGE